jgi:hypothetical protein
VFSPEEFSALEEAANHLIKFAESGQSLRVWLYKAEKMGVKKDTCDMIVNSVGKLLENLPAIISEFPDYGRLAPGYIAMPKFELTGTNFKYPIHLDSTTKSLTFVVYIAPENHKGTLIYNGKDESNFLFEAEWKQNRAFLICPRSAKTAGWHTWENNLDMPRVTLNITCQQIDTLPGYLKDFSEEDQEDAALWLYDNFGREKLIHVFS